ncbi:MAG: universal stress protein [Candidatus Hydrothermarchaeota archaeon]
MKILVPVDESDYARAVVEAAGELAKRYEAQVLLLHVFNERKYKMYEQMYEEMNEEVKGAIPLRTTEDFKQDATILAEGVGSALKGKGLRAKALGRVGDPAEEIVKVAEEEKVDMIVIGFKGATNVERFLIGPTAKFVAEHAHCTVMIVKGKR